MCNCNIDRYEFCDECRPKTDEERRYEEALKEIVELGTRAKAEEMRMIAWTALHPSKWNDPSDFNVGSPEGIRVWLLLDYGAGSVEVEGRAFYISGFPSPAFADQGGWVTTYVKGWRRWMDK